MSAPSEGWWTRAACAGLDPAMFFPEGPNARTDAAAAKRVCASCPVRSDCLGADLQAVRYHDHEMDGAPRTTGKPFGIVAAMSAGERR